MLVSFIIIAHPCKLRNYISDSLPLPDDVHITAIDIGSRQLHFKWSPVAPDCPAIHYNILASNCGSCPTITNHTTVTCTDVPTNGSTCTFAVQMVVCVNVAGNLSDPISIILTNSFYPADTSSTDTVYIVAISCLAVALIVCVVMFTTVIVIMSLRNKVRKKATVELQLENRAAKTVHTDSMYEDVTNPSNPVGAIISTQDNVAYGHMQTPTH